MLAGIYSEWFPSVPYEHSESDFDPELYFRTRNADCGVEIYVPVMKKKMNVNLPPNTTVTKPSLIYHRETAYVRSLPNCFCYRFSLR